MNMYLYVYIHTHVYDKFPGWHCKMETGIIN